jgi:hypothetical protein
MKILLWRFAHDCLPSGHQLCRRQIPASDACLFCNREERVEHTLLFCPYAREVWRPVKAAYLVRLCRCQLITTKQWLMDFFARSDDGAAVTLAVMVWHLWEARNVVRNEEERKHQYSLAEQIKAYIHMILLQLSKSPSTQRREPKPLPSWLRRRMLRQSSMSMQLCSLLQVE